MPTYVYKFIETGETIEVQQSFTDETLTEAVHPESGETMPVKKVFLPVGVTFKGDGFYKTDSRSTKATPSTSGETSGDSSGDSPGGSTSSTSTSTASSGSSSSESGSSSSASTSGSGD